MKYDFYKCLYPLQVKVELFLITLLTWFMHFNKYIVQVKTICQFKINITAEMSISWQTNSMCYHLKVVNS